MPATIHQLEVTLRDVEPPVWRRIEVRSETPLDEVAALLEAAMGWYGGHLHMFEADGTVYGMAHPGLELVGDVDESRYRMSDVLPEVGKTMRWEYDLGDGWDHDVVVEAIAPPHRARPTRPVSTDGGRVHPRTAAGPGGTPSCSKCSPTPNGPTRWTTARGCPTGSTRPASTPRSTPLPCEIPDRRDRGVEQGGVPTDRRLTLPLWETPG